ncbi:hypothetical protein [Duganella sp. Root336D2]|uniref:hypothetical protein n=1 Tax=unclassified Duganella TaxID=2636909 RepID=UPI000AB52AE9
MVNTWADLLLKYWQFTEMAEMVAPYKDLPPSTSLASMDLSLQRALAAEPGMKVGFVAFPGTPFTSAHHYGIFMRGDQVLTSRLYQPVLVDVQTAQVTDNRDLPWYLTAPLISQPLHFGGYGGQLMKLLWALLDIETITALVGDGWWDAASAVALGAPAVVGIYFGWMRV